MLPLEWQSRHTPVSGFDEQAAALAKDVVISSVIHEEIFANALQSTDIISGTETGRKLKEEHMKSLHSPNWS